MAGLTRSHLFSSNEVLTDLDFLHGDVEGNSGRTIPHYGESEFLIIVNLPCQKAFRSQYSGISPLEIHTLVLTRKA